jgi:hypothetical protein
MPISIYRRKTLQKDIISEPENKAQGATRFIYLLVFGISMKVVDFL